VTHPDAAGIDIHTGYRGPGAIVNGVAELIPVATDQLAWRGVAMRV
jgi:hypothetical protein